MKSVTRLLAGFSYMIIQLVVIASLLSVLVSFISAYAEWILQLYPLLTLTLLAIASLALRGNTGYAAMPLLLWVAVVSIMGQPYLWALILVIIAMPLSKYYSAGHAPTRLPTGEDIRNLLQGSMVLIGLSLVVALVLFAAYKLYTLLPQSILPRAQGDLPAMYQVLGKTLVFHILTLSAVIYIAYKGLELILSTLVHAIAKPPSLPALETLALYKKWHDTLVRMKGRQYGILRWAQLFFLTTLLSPLFLPITRILIANTLTIDPRIGTAAYIISGYALGWIFTRILSAMLIDQPRPDQLLRPTRPGNILIFGFALVGTLIISYAAVGGDPVQLLIETLTGRPRGPDPLAEAIDINGLEENVILFAKLLVQLLETAIRFLWGG